MRVLIFGDLHIPSHDKHAADCMLAFAKDFKPDTLVCLGDLVDFDLFSRFLRDPRKAKSPQKDLDLARMYVKQFEAATPTAKRVFLYGNHEERLYKYILKNAPNLIYLHCLNLNELLGLESWRVIRYPHYVQLGQLIILHGQAYGSTVNEKNISKFGGYHVVQGHSHRLSQRFNRGVSGTHSSCESGCLCSLTPTYTQRPNWQHGFITFNGKQLRLHYIEHGRLV